MFFHHIFALLQQVPNVEFTPDFLAVVAGVLLSLLFSYAPGFANWYNLLEAEYKSLLMLAFNLIITAVVFTLGCYGFLGGIDCSVNGGIQFFWVFLQVIIPNQITHVASPKVGLKKLRAK